MTAVGGRAVDLSRCCYYPGLGLPRLSAATHSYSLRCCHMPSYQAGEFYQWLKDCEEGRADPVEGFPYPLLVQARRGWGSCV